MRLPAVADRFYPADEEEAREDIEACFRSGPGMPVAGSCKEHPRAVVVPHAGYMFSGPCAAFAFKAIAEAPKPEAYVVIGPDHYGNGYPLSMCTEEYWTPFGECETAWEIAAPLSKLVPDVPSAHAREHSIEVVLPFLKYVDPEARIVPIIMGDQNKATAELLSDALMDLADEHDIVFIASSDLVHYVPKSYADVIDARFLAHVRNLDVDGIYSCVYEDKLSVCGYGPIATVVTASCATHAEVLCQTDSSAAGLDEDSVVGYGSVAMY